MSPFMPSMIAGDDYIPFGLEFVSPFVLGAIGAVLSVLDRSLDEDTRRGWAAASFLTGLLALPVVAAVAGLIEAIEWRINGPPLGICV